jgi:hypothetical protein
MTIAELKTMWEPEAQGRIDNWNQVRDSFPDAGLSLYGPGVDSGTYDYFTAAVVGKEHSSRGDFTATEDDNIIIQGVSNDPGALGFLGLAYLTENLGRVKPVGIERDDGSCVLPSVEAARDASYQPLSRPLFMYVNKAHADDNDGVRRYVEFVLDPHRPPSSWSPKWAMFPFLRKLSSLAWRSSRRAGPGRSSAARPRSASAWKICCGSSRSVREPAPEDPFGPA